MNWQSNQLPEAQLDPDEESYEERMTRRQARRDRLAEDEQDRAFSEHYWPEVED